MRVACAPVALSSMRARRGLRPALLLWAALLGLWVQALGCAGAELSAATALAQQAELSRAASSQLDYLPPLSDRCLARLLPREGLL